MKITPLLLVLAPIAAHAGGWQIDTQTDPQTHKPLTTYTATAINESGKQVKFSLQCEPVLDEKIDITWGKGYAADTVSYDSLSLDLQFTGITFKPDEVISVMWRPIWDEDRKGFSPRIRKYNTVPDSDRAYSEEHSIHFRDIYTDVRTLKPTNKIALNVSSFYTDETWFIETPDLSSVSEKLSSPEFCNGKAGHATYFKAFGKVMKVAQQKNRERINQEIVKSRQKSKAN